jgi:hypothetical protein
LKLDNEHRRHDEEVSDILTDPGKRVDKDAGNKDESGEERNRCPGTFDLVTNAGSVSSLVGIEATNVAHIY